MLLANQNELNGKSQQAIVIGGSITGLLASWVLADYFEQVTVIDRDQFPSTPSVRKGVPQGQHIHVLLSKGETILEQFFPRILTDLLAGGAVSIDTAADMRWFHFGGWKVRFPSKITYHSQSRPFLEWHIRQRVVSKPNIQFLTDTQVTQLLINEDRNRFTGVQIRRSNSDEEQLFADLVIDTSGRGSKTPQWLDALGYSKPVESTLKVDVGYASRLYCFPKPLPHDWKTLFIYPLPPTGKRGGVIAPIEEDSWIVTLVGWLRDYPPSDEAGFLEFVRSLEALDLYQVIQEAEPQTPIVTHKLPSNRRRHYECLSLPEGLIILGDALCSFNPVYGQGISTSAWSALTLQTCLHKQRRRYPNGDITGLTKRVQKQVAKIIDIPWLLATSEDSRYPEAEGARPFWIKGLHWYIAKVHQLSHIDPAISQRFLQTIHMIKPPVNLFHPYVVFRVLTTLWRS